MLETQKAKANLADIQAELELETAKLINEAQQKLELSKIDEEIAKAKAVETVYMKEEEAALPTRSCGSNISRVSMRSSIVQKAKIAELEAERKARLKTQQAEMEIQRIKEEHNIELKRRLRVSKHRSTEDG